MAAANLDVVLLNLDLHLIFLNLQSCQDEKIMD